MRFALSKLLIRPRDRSKRVRVVSFNETGLNLITGSSRSGKSAVIKIIDYCLGSRTCNIPKLGPIRRSAAWYGIVVRTEEGYKLLARRDPDGQAGTDDYLIAEGATPSYPEFPSKNANRAEAKVLLARLARLPQATADYDETGSGFKGRPSFGDMTAFMFQPQPIVANDRVLFFEADDPEHASKIREIFPLVLGAIDSDTMVMLHRLADVRRLLDRKRRQLDALKSSIQDYAGAVRGRYVGAVDAGLIQADIGSIDQADVNVLIERLREVAKRWKEGQRTEADPAVFSSAPRIAELRHREAVGAQQVSSLRLRKVQLRELAQARQLAEGALVRERDRLSPTFRLLDTVSSIERCPFCGSENHTASTELTRLRERVSSVEAQWHGLAAVPPMLDAEEIEVQRALTAEDERLRQIRAERAELEQITATARRTAEEQALFIGKLTEFLSLQREISGDSALADEIDALTEEEEHLRSQVDPEVIAQRKEDALLLISRYAQQYGQIVALENNDALIKLDTRELTIRVIKDTGEWAWLHQIGSGANHLGYHVATLLALHDFFINKPIPYVPSLLVLDQPSQTQFPDDDEEAEEEELVAVHKAFEAFDHAIDRTRGVLQVIVSEHAGKVVYAGIKHLKLVERWRRGRKLIPWHWDAQALELMNGLRADCALEDLREEALSPAVADSLGISAPAYIDALEIRRATFQGLGIAFTLGVEVVRSNIPPDEGGQASTVRSSHVFDGLIRQDLSVSLSQRQAD